MTELQKAIKLLHSPHKENFDIAITMLDYVDGLKDYLHSFDCLCSSIDGAPYESHFYLFGCTGIYSQYPKLSSLPNSIGNLTNLKTLYLDKNQLSSVPQSIGNLKNLKTLNLGYNQLRGIPESIGNLTNLKVLYLYNNQLTELPESIGNLSNLDALIIDNNQLTELPDSIGNLTDLKTLHIDKHVGNVPSHIPNVKRY